MKFTCISGDSQDRVHGLLKLARIVGDGKSTIKHLLEDKRRFDLTPIEIKTIEDMEKILNKCWHEFIFEVRVPTE
jgi:hypothetical protein